MQSVGNDEHDSAVRVGEHSFVVKSRPDRPGEPISADSGSPSRWADSIKAMAGRAGGWRRNAWKGVPCKPGRPARKKVGVQCP